MTFAGLKIGTVINYKDMSNNNDYIVLDTYTNRFGTYVNIINKETNYIDSKEYSTKVKDRWTIVKEA